MAVAVALTSGSVRSRIRRFINENFFSLKYDYRLEWEKVIRSLSLNPEQASAERVLRTLCDLLDSHGGALWVHRASWRQFLPAAKLGFSADFVPIPEEDPRLEPFRSDDKAFIDLADAGDGSPAAALWRKDFASSWLVVPLRYRSMVVGLVVLAKTRAPKKLDWEDESLIRLVGLQLGAYLVQEETAQSLADARQLEEFNKRFAFIVHDIKNTIGQLSLLVQNAAQFGHEQEFRDDMVITLRNAVERLQQLLNSLTSVGNENVPGLRPVEVIDLVRFIKEFTKEKGNLGQAVILNTDYQSLDLKLMDVSSLRRVLEHVVTNAAEASRTGEHVEISVTADAKSAQIKVTDHGAGMTEKFINEELFRPMRTTKDGGFGIGAYQARELMRDLGGDILVSSKVGEGTSVTLSLPRTAAPELRAG
jgi:putative PEP-CTERM system histidine kinase